MDNDFVLCAVNKPVPSPPRSALPPLNVTGHTQGRFEEPTSVTSPEAGAMISKAQSPNKSASQNCRIQVHLPDGGILRNEFLPMCILADVCTLISQNKPTLTSIKLLQPFPHREFSAKEQTQTLQDLCLCPSASLVVKKEMEAPFQPLAVSGGSPAPQTKSSSRKDDESMDVTPAWCPSPATFPAQTTHTKFTTTTTMHVLYDPRIARFSAQAPFPSSEEPSCR